jgi:putative hemolysin
MATELWLEVVLVLLLIMANGFFSGSEIAVVSMRRSRIDQLADQGNVSARIVGRLKEDSDRFLATVQIGVTLVGSLASAVGGASAIEYIGPLLQQSSVPFLQEWSQALALGIVVLTISYLSLVVGELVPKSLALRYPEQIACAVARPLDLLSRLFSLVVKLLTASSNLLLFLTRSGAKSTEALVSEEEVKYLVREGAQKGIFDDTEQEFIHSVFAFADKTVREVLTPRTEVHALEALTSCPQAIQQMIDSGFSRMPVYEEDLDHILGIVHIKELLRAQAQGQTTELRNLLHPARFVPDSMQISHLLKELQVHRAHMALVLNEFGTVIGLVTTEDLLEEIVGEIHDEFDVDEEQPIQELSPGVLLVDGGITVSELREQHHLPLEETRAYRTVAGFLLARLERIPKGGETILYQDCRFTIMVMDGRRVAKVKIEKLADQLQLAAAVRDKGAADLGHQTEKP